ncbi:g8860 [Coccomyxa viridis]|uniref:dolichyl-phosphate beta-glucosyltransferase n=1 Tax=Coccomyxa viridis TaxID=1274662 RepID=A0ABP1G859_9CHLO
MHLPLAGTAVLVIAILVVLQHVQSWFRKHDDDASTFSERVFERPRQLEKVPIPSIFSEATKSLTIVIPAYNEERRLPSTLEETFRYLQRRRDAEGGAFSYEVIVVDDGSTDSTVHQAFEHVQRHGFDALRVLQLARNHGKGYAVKAGMLVGRGDLLLFMDADGATRVSDLEKLEAALAAISSGNTAGQGSVGQKKNSTRIGLGIAAGSRAHLEGRALSQRSWSRNLLMHGFHLLVLLVAGGAIKDTQCGFKLFTRQAAQLLYSNQRLQRWCFDVELLFLAQHLEVPVVEECVNWTEIPGSKVSLVSILHMTWEMVAILIAYRWLKIWHIRSLAEIYKSQ